MDPYEGFKVYGPYPDRSQPGRLMMTLIRSSDGYRTTTPYPRFLMARKLGRALSKDEHVDHIDDDRSNNSIENLQILTPQENQVKGKTKPLLKLLCPNCGMSFERTRHRVREAWRKEPVKVPTCCSRRCARQYQHKVLKGA